MNVTIHHYYDRSQYRYRTKQGYPLKIEATKVVVEKSPVDIDLTIKMLSKVKYDAVLCAVEDIRSSLSSSSSSTEAADESPMPKIIIPDNLPAALPDVGGDSGDNDDEYDYDEKLLNALGGRDSGAEGSSMIESLHFILFNLHVIEGSLVCPDTGRKFPIKDGIPNMILHEDEIWPFWHGKWRWHVTERCDPIRRGVVQSVWYCLL